MNKKRLIGIGTVVCICGIIALLGMVLSEKGKGIITDQEGNMVAELTFNDKQLRYECTGGYESYMDIVCAEAIEALMAAQDINKEKAGKLLASEGVDIRTWFEPKVTEAISDAYAEDARAGAQRFGAAVSDTSGHMTACFSDGKTADSYNNVTFSTYAGSTMKPLSVFGPALEDGTINWSSLYQDSAYTMARNELGVLTEWPENTVPYTGKWITAAEALEKSNNAVAVKVLKDYGVKKATTFLKNEFGYSVERELELIEEEGEDKVLSNIALGYLENGVTVRQMLDAYQIFANGGKYTKLHTIKEIVKDGKTLYLASEEQRQVFSEEAAYIMNRMLRGVVTDGTAVSGQIEGMDVCGKTGTSVYGDHWFVGMTPQSVCAVWYQDADAADVTDDSVRICRGIFERTEKDSTLSYPMPENVVKKAYCKKSGLLAGENCRETAEGYYIKDKIPDTCHGLCGKIDE